MKTIKEVINLLQYYNRNGENYYIKIRDDRSASIMKDLREESPYYLKEIDNIEEFDE